MALKYLQSARKKRFNVKKIFCLICLLFPMVSHASNFWQWIRGTTPANAVLILPGGLHTRDPGQFKNFQFVGARYHSVMLATFYNSFGDRTYALGINRSLWTHKRFSVGYTVGAIEGYGGKLSMVRGIPFKHSFLWTGDVNPLVGAFADFQLMKHLALNAFVEPLVIVYGVAITW